MAVTKYQGTGALTSADFKAVKWIGKTKNGSVVRIVFEKAVNIGNIDWTFAEKGETVAQIVMTAVYANTDTMAEDTKEPWTIEIDGELDTASGEIILEAGKFYVNNEAVALTRGGGSFNVTRTFRRINADGDRGDVEGRIAMDESVATLTLNSLQILSRLSDLYPAIATID